MSAAPPETVPTSARPGASVSRAWLRALELTAPIPRRRDRVLPAVVDELGDRLVDKPARLSDRECLTWGNYAGFPDSPYYAQAQNYLNGQACSLLTVGVRGGYEAAVRFYDALKLVICVVNLGDAKSLACHPASTTHRQMSPDEQRKAGVLPEMIRLSIGIEHIDDILADIDQALNAALGIRH
jgi:hypothetical protein